MDKFAANFIACVVFASASLSAVAEESHDVSNQWKNPGQDQVTYVSGKGKDVGDCKSPSNPCRSFQYAVDHTADGGEVKALDPANFFPVVIRKSITITGVPGAGINTVSGRAVDAIRTGASSSGYPLSTVHIDNLVIENVGNADGSRNGAYAIYGKYISVSNCTIRGFKSGISIGQNGHFLITNTIVTNNTTGLELAEVSGTLDHVTVNNNGTGISADQVTLHVVDTSVSDNGGTGILFREGSLYLAHSTITGNSTGIDFSRTFATSFGDNHIKGNGKDVVSYPANDVLVNVGTQ